LRFLEAEACDPSFDEPSGVGVDGGEVTGGIGFRVGEGYPGHSPQGVPQDGVDELVPSRGQALCRGDGLVDGGIGGDLFGEADLVEGDPQDVPDDRFQRAGLSPVEAVDQKVQQTPHAQRAVDEEGQQPPVGLFRGAPGGQDAVQQGLGEGLLVIDAGQDADGKGPGVVFQGWRQLQGVLLI